MLILRSWVSPPVDHDRKNASTRRLYILDMILIYWPHARHQRRHRHRAPPARHREKRRSRVGRLPRAGTPRTGVLTVLFADPRPPPRAQAKERRLRREGYALLGGGSGEHGGAPVTERAAAARCAGLHFANRSVRGRPRGTRVPGAVTSDLRAASGTHADRPRIQIAAGTSRRTSRSSGSAD